MDSIRALFIMVALITGITCVYFGYNGVNGGAIGLGFISGMSLVATAITYIGREEIDYTKHK